jgi:AmmeMemoRadiSam system protein A
MAEEHALVQLARKTIETYITQRVTLKPPKTLADLMKTRAGAFVSLHRGGQLRGCIGTIEPQRENLAQEIIANAISAASSDPRFPPLTRDELADLEISVDVLSEPERISTLAGHDPKEYGLIVQSGNRRGLLLPDLEGVDTAEQQVQICLRKAWIDPKEPYQMYRFRVVRYH